MPIDPVANLRVSAQSDLRDVLRQALSNELTLPRPAGAVSLPKPSQTYTAVGPDGVQSVVESSVTSPFGVGEAKVSTLDRAGGPKAGKSVSAVETFTPVVKSGGNELTLLVGVRNPNTLAVGARWLYKAPNATTTVDAQRVFSADGSASFNEFKVNLSTAGRTKFAATATAIVIDYDTRVRSSFQGELGVAFPLGQSNAAVTGVLVLRPTASDSIGLRATLGSGDTSYQARCDWNYKAGAGASCQLGLTAKF